MVKKIFGAVAVVALAFAFTVNFAAAATYNFTQTLTVGSQGAEVVMLQDFLISKGHLVMPVGVSKGYFGGLTASALGRYQASVGIAPAVGYFGPITRAHFNMLEMGGGTTTPDDDDDDTNSGELQGGDGDFRSFEILSSPSNEDIEEGETIEVLGFEFEADGSDLRVERVDVLFASTTGAKPWKVFEDISIVDEDEDEIVSVDGSDEENWSEEEDDEYSIRFDDVDYVVEDGEEVRLYVAVTATDDLDEDEMGEWSVQLMSDGVRALNAEGIDVYEGGTDEEIDASSDEREFSLEEAAEGEFDISVDENDEGNEDDQVEVSEDEDTEDVILYTASVESDEGSNLIEDITVDIATTSGTVGNLSDIIRTLYLWVDGEEVGSESVDAAGTDSVSFDDIDVEVEDGEEVQIQVSATINEQGDNEDNYSDGDAVVVTGMTLEYVDENDDDLTESETTDGGEISFSVDALMVDFVSKEEDVYGSQESRGEYTIVFKVTAPEEEDIFIDDSAASSTGSTSYGASFSITGPGNASSTLAELTSDDVEVEDSGFFRVNEGDTAEFELHVILSNNGGTVEGAYKIALEALGYRVGSTGATAQLFTSGIDSEYETGSVLLLRSDVQ